MPNLKDLKTRINSVSSTQKITSAMKMVAAAKLRRAQEAAESGRPYAARMRSVIASLAAKADKNSASPLLVGRETVKTHLLVMVSADKGLCGGFNGSIARLARQEISRLEAEGKKVQIYVVGRKAADNLGSEIADKTFARIEGVQGGVINYSSAADISEKIIAGFEDGSFDSVSMIYNQFVNAITQNVVHTRLFLLKCRPATKMATQMAIFMIMSLKKQKFWAHYCHRICQHSYLVPCWNHPQPNWQPE